MGMTFEEKANKAYELKSEYAEIEKQKKELDEKAKALEAEIDEINASLLSDMKANGAIESKVGDVYVNLMRRESIGYDDPDAVLGYLEANGLGNLIRVKRELDKKAINKEVKCNGALAEALAGMTSKKVTEYVVVTDSENHRKMLEHIEGSRK